MIRTAGNCKLIMKELSNNFIWNIIARHLAGETNDDDKSALNEWLSGNKKNQFLLDRLAEIWQHNPQSLSRSGSIYKTFKNRLGQYKKEKSKFLYYFLRIAASVLLLAGTIAIIYNNYPAGRTDITTCQEISVPRGSRTLILLPDSSKIWLSNNSKIKYPNQFVGGKRELELSGEAYFEVTPNSDNPFIVKIGPDRIKVLGTKFSVTSYPEDGRIRADLLSGSIQLDINQRKGSESFKSFLVKPSQSVVYEKASGRLSVSEIPEGFFDYWKNGVYSFKNESLESLAQRIYRIYNVNIVFEDDLLKDKRFSGTLSIDDNIFTFMEAVKRTSLDPVDYRYENKNIYIKLKKR